MSQAIGSAKAGTATATSSALTAMMRRREIGSRPVATGARSWARAPDRRLRARAAELRGRLPVSNPVMESRVSFSTDPPP
ncbi:hypothetical protein GCM10022600_21500 [Qipengyuania pelagi]